MSAQRLYELDRSSARFPGQLHELLHSKEWTEELRHLPEGDLVEVTDYLDGILDGLDRAGSPFRKCLHVLQKLCGFRMVLPSTYEVSGELSFQTGQRFAYGGSCDFYKGYLAGADICIKRLRVSISSDKAKVRQALCREAVIWKHLIHPNIVPFKGVTLEPLQLVSEWLPGGRLKEHFRDNHDADLIGVLLGVARGLGYLHSCNVIHGGLNGTNIVVDANGNAQIVDFGLATIAQDTSELVSVDDGQGITARYTAPEILKTVRRHSKESDVFSFGMVIVEVFTGNVPFHNSITAAAIVSIITGERPKRPTHSSFNDRLWALTRQCWTEKPQDRPQMDEVIKQLADQAPQTRPTQPIEPPRSHNPETSPSTTTPRTSIIRDTTPVASKGGSEGELGDDGAGGSNRPPELSPPPILPPPPTNCFPREEIVNEVLDLTDQVASTALFGSIGVGKSSVALTLLHHERTKIKFGGNRHFMRCENLTNSLEAFLERLSDVINTDRTKNTEQLRLHLESSPPFMLILDGVDFILDPLAIEAEDISATIEELGGYEHVCLVTTSRMNPEIHGFHRIEVPTLPEDGAREAFYSLCDLGRSPTVDDLITTLDFHPLSIDLLARSVRENDWDEAILMKVWDDGEAGALKSSYHQNLKDAIELSLRFPTVQNLGTTAQDVLKEIAASPLGVEEGRLENIFPRGTGVGMAVDVLCRFSVTYRQDGFVKMLSPFRLYFLEYTLTLAEDVEVIRWGADCAAAEAVFPAHTRGPVSPRLNPRRRTSLRENWVRRLQAVKRILHALFGRPGVSVNLGDMGQNPAPTLNVASA